MNFTDRLRDHLKAHDRTQKEVAMSWLEAWNTTGRDSQKPDTVETRLSELLNGKPRGVQHFLADPARLELVLTVLDVPDAERDAWRSDAEVLRVAGPDGLPRLILDLAGLVSDRDAAERLFTAAESWLKEPRLLPARMVVDDAAFRWMPRTLDNLPGLTIERVADAAAAGVLLGQRSHFGALVITANAEPPTATWAVPFMMREALHLDPAEAIPTYLAGQPLPEAPPPQHTLSALIDLASPEHQAGWRAMETRPDGTLKGWVDGSPPPPSLTAIERRRLRLTLPDPAVTHPGLTWGQRLDLGAQLGVTVAASDVERAAMARALTAAAVRIDAGLAPSTPDGLAAALARAANRPTSNRIVWVDGVTHVINPTQPVPHHIILAPFVRVHHVAHREPVFTRLLTLIADWTADDFDLDPALLGPCRALLEAGEPPRVLAHARQAVLRQAPRLVAPMDPDVLEALRRVITATAPPARLMWRGNRLQPETADWHDWYPANGALSELFGDLPQEYAMVAVPRHSVGQGEEVQVRQSNGHEHVTVSVDQWLDQIDRNSWVRGGGHPSGSVFAESFKPELEHWRDADLEVACLWQALKVALAAPVATPLYDGGLLLQLGSLQVVATARRRHLDAPARAVVPAWSESTPWRPGVRVYRESFYNRQTSRGRLSGRMLIPWFEISAGRDVVRLEVRVSPWT